jgi:hypothetical protein
MLGSPPITTLAEAGLVKIVDERCADPTARRLPERGRVTIRRDAWQGRMGVVCWSLVVSIGVDRRDGGADTNATSKSSERSPKHLFVGTAPRVVFAAFTKSAYAGAARATVAVPRCRLPRRRPHSSPASLAAEKRVCPT